MGNRFYEKNHTVANPFHNDENILVQRDASVTSFLCLKCPIFTTLWPYNCSLVEIIHPAPETSVGRHHFLQLWTVKTTDIVSSSIYGLLLECWILLSKRPEESQQCLKLEKLKDKHVSIVSRLVNKYHLQQQCRMACTFLGHKIWLQKTLI